MLTETEADRMSAMLLRFAESVEDFVDDPEYAALYDALQAALAAVAVVPSHSVRS